MCKSYPEAKRYFYAVKDFIETRLKLQINEEKSGVINLNKNSTNFLGFKIKVVEKGNTRTGKIAKTNISDKAIKKIKKNLNNKIKDIQRNQCKESVMKYNLEIIGIHNYYKIATNVYNNLDDVNYIITKRIKNRLKNNSKTILFKDVNNNNDEIPPINEEIIILKILVLLLSIILTDVIIIISMIMLNKKNKSIYIFIY